MIHPVAVPDDGRRGRPLIIFPCLRGRCCDDEGMGMIDAVAGFIDAASWYDFGVAATSTTSPEIAGIWEIPGY